jgi:hypothetical protein
MEPHSLISIVIRTNYFTGLDFPQPLHIIMLGMDPPSGMIGDAEERILLSPVSGQPLIVGLSPLNPMGNRLPVFVIREVFG